MPWYIVNTKNLDTRVGYVEGNYDDYTPALALFDQMVAEVEEHGVGRITVWLEVATGEGVVELKRWNNT